MIKLAIAVGFLSVFGLVGVVIIYLLSKNQNQENNTKTKKQK